MRSEDDDRELMRRLAARESEALEALYAKYGGLVYGIALRVLGDPAMAEEATQDAFLRAWRGAAAYSPERGAPATWLGRIARNWAIDALRSTRARGALARDDWSEFEDSRALGPEEEAGRDSRAAQVREAVAALPEAQRTALSLAFFEGLTHVEIARRLGLPLGTVKSRIREAMRALRDALSEGAGE
jgi:RNA polymerase sigma-70 factor (ECF subfamily)